MRVMPLALAAVCLASSQAKEPDVSDLLAADRAFYADTHARGLDGWLAWFAPDAIVLKSDGGLMSGEAEMRAYYESLAFPPAGFTWTAEAGEIAASGDLGYTVGSWELRRPAGAPPSDKPVPAGRYLTVWGRQPDGSYKVVTDTGGEPDFRTRLSALDGPPLEWSSTTERTRTAASGELAFALGSWKAKSAQKELEGRFLTVWRRTADGAWVIASETGFEL